MDINEEVNLDAACEAYASYMTANRVWREQWIQRLRADREYIELQESLCYRRMLGVAFGGVK